jgi:uncharacterized protein YlxW (UPF0749 family)
MPASTDLSAPTHVPRDAAGLVDLIQETALDPGYRVAAERGRRPPFASRALTAGIMALFAALLATAALQAHRNAPVQASDRQSLITQIDARKAQLSRLSSRVARLNRTVADLTAEGLSSTQAGRGTDATLTLLGVAAGTAPVTGPGIRITVDDAPATGVPGGTVLDRDLQVLVNGLWSSGAEAVAINNQRVTPLTAIRQAGDAITVNFRSLSRPYVVTAIGNPDTLAVKFTKSAGGQTWLSLQNVYGLRFEIASARSLDLPGTSVPTIRYARPLEVTP